MTGDESFDLEAARHALQTDMTIDIITTGARSGRDGPLLPRDRLANLLVNPEFLFCFKESPSAQITDRGGGVHRRLRWPQSPSKVRRVVTARSRLGEGKFLADRPV